MSGSNSSARATAEHAEALALAVHGLPAPELPRDARRTRAGRIKMLVVLLAISLWPPLTLWLARLMTGG